MTQAQWDLINLHQLTGGSLEHDVLRWSLPSLGADIAAKIRSWGFAVDYDHLHREYVLTPFRNHLGSHPHMDLVVYIRDLLEGYAYVQDQ
jgi:hypothetical protein